MPNTPSFAKLALLAAIGVGISIAIGSAWPSMAGQREAPPSEIPELETDNPADANPTDVAQEPEAPLDPMQELDPEAPPIDPAESLETGSELDPTSDTEAAAEETIVDVATAAGSFGTLTQALEAADLVETLESDGPFTVFAPTDEAFEALPAGTLEELLLPENKEQLVQVLTYHVVPGAVQSSDLVDGDVMTVEGSAIAVSTGEQVTVNDAEVLQPDIDASNGVIHVIDAVLL
ncbi:MAG: fasciclin domain-containing protein, partial [Cyanobacteria bacterium J06648_11]